MVPGHGHIRGPRCLGYPGTMLSLEELLSSGVWGGIMTTSEVPHNPQRGSGRHQADTAACTSLHVLSGEVLVSPRLRAAGTRSSSRVLSDFCLLGPRKPAFHLSLRGSLVFNASLRFQASVGALHVLSSGRRRPPRARLAPPWPPSTLTHPA